MPGFDIDSYLRISLSDMLLVAISTLLLTAAGKVLFWDKVSAYLTSRRQIMRQEMDEAMTLRAKADRLQALREQQLEEAQAKAAHIVQTAREEADALHARELVQTRREINALRAQSEAQLRALRQQEARRAAGAIADIAAAVSEKLSGKQADAALHARYVEEWLSESDDHPWQAGAKPLPGRGVLRMMSSFTSCMKRRRSCRRRLITSLCFLTRCFPLRERRACWKRDLQKKRIRRQWPS